MAPQASIEFTVIETLRLIDSGVQGDLAEFGTWKGGNSFAMLLAQREAYGKIVKPVWMFDSFEGLPDADERDGPAAIQYQQDTTSPDYFDNCTAPLAGVQAAITSFGFGADEAIVVPGWFDATIPTRKADLQLRGLSMLRIDCDWYEPVKLVLDEVAPTVSEQGTIILDDYYTWDGCAKATHDYLSQSQIPFRIRSLPKFYAAWMTKPAAITN